LNTGMRGVLRVPRSYDWTATNGKGHLYRPASTQTEVSRADERAGQRSQGAG